ncbi:hypothetical protein LASUN_20210 [Lentilactobacillus sunkii]|jgi:uncharacterized protein YozE (UPF0346 family)|uniref:UPF0346 protein FD17_GL000692 n=3 Tax=Lentilactobacillus sunkii TaxID=481719 RepID=A0A0R1KX81_9LACO|nr:YozE family protein [Lentilactobacillus sunkii]KRK87864.1 hypothetical protein FD17_GL000692 [Lentilactobacillus sunkii DSM 19904]OFA10082.1 hypothetical protein LASUN_20210 [Lentilactobacillus sunkii]
MQKTFYQFLMTKRNPGSSDPEAEFANNAFYDQSFPKQEDEFDELSKYLEENASYLPTMEIFDSVWKEYQESF